MTTKIININSDLPVTADAVSATRLLLLEGSAAFIGVLVDIMINRNGKCNLRLE